MPSRPRPKGWQIYTRVDQETYERIRAMAQEQDRPVSAWIRFLVQRELKEAMAKEVA